jgi:hypothetical protein
LEYLISNQSGVSRRVYDEHSTPSDASDDTIVSTTLKDIAHDPLKMYPRAGVKRMAEAVQEKHHW